MQNQPRKINPNPTISIHPPPPKTMYNLLTKQSLRLAFPASLLQWPTRQGTAAIPIASTATGQAGLHSVDYARVSATIDMDFSILICGFLLFLHLTLCVCLPLLFCGEIL